MKTPGLVLLGIAIIWTCLLPARFTAGRTAPADAASQTELVLAGDLAGSGIFQLVEWHRLGPFPPTISGNPSTYVRELVVRAGGEGSTIVAHWKAAPTTIVAFYPKLNGLWPVRGTKGSLISTAVQYGGRVLDLYIFRLEGIRLKEVGHMEGQNLSMVRRGGRLAVEVVPDDYYRVPTLYAWNGGAFVDASREFPEFYASLATSYVAGVHNPHPLPAEAIVQACQLALQAYDIAEQPHLGWRACLDAEERLSSGREIVPSSARESTQEFDREKRQAIQRIRRILGELKPSS